MQNEGSIHLDDAHADSELALQLLRQLSPEQEHSLLYWLSGYAPQAIMRGVELHGWLPVTDELGSVSTGL
jgi:hypothetical protein